MKSRTTLKDVAAVVGLSISSTAKAFKGRPGFPQTTIDRVRAVALEMGYLPDPLLSALSAYRQAKHPANYVGTAGFLSMRYTEQQFLKSDGGDLLLGARSRARDLGYKIEYFNIGTTRTSQESAARLLTARGIQGILIRSFPYSVEENYFPFNRFMGINLFSDPHIIKLPTLSSYHSQAMKDVMARLHQMGYRHPALFIHHQPSHYIKHGWLTSFHEEAAQFRELSTFNPVDLPEAEVLDWIKSHSADVVIYARSEDFIPPSLLPGAEEEPPVDVVCMDVLKPNSPVSGVFQNRFRAGRIAIEWLQTLLINYQVGSAQDLTAVMVPGDWNAGKTLRRVAGMGACGLFLIVVGSPAAAYVEKIA